MSINFTEMLFGKSGGDEGRSEEGFSIVSRECPLELVPRPAILKSGWNAPKTSHHLRARIQCRHQDGWKWIEESSVIGIDSQSVGAHLHRAKHHSSGKQLFHGICINLLLPSSLIFPKSLSDLEAGFDIMSVIRVEVNSNRLPVPFHFPSNQSIERSSVKSPNRSVLITNGFAKSSAMFVRPSVSAFCVALSAKIARDSSVDTMTRIR